MCPRMVSVQTTIVCGLQNKSLVVYSSSIVARIVCILLHIKQYTSSNAAKKPATVQLLEVGKIASETKRETGNRKPSAGRRGRML